MSEDKVTKIFVVMVDDWGSVFSKPTTPHGAYFSKKEAKESVKHWPESSYKIHKMDLHTSRAYAPHCDSSILHAPGACEHCDKYPDWQEARERFRVAFTGELAGSDKAPCPSTWFRDAEKRDQWPGNRVEPKKSVALENVVYCVGGPDPVQHVGPIIPLSMKEYAKSCTNCSYIFEMMDCSGPGKHRGPWSRLKGSDQADQCDSCGYVSGK